MSAQHATRDDSKTFEAQLSSDDHENNHKEVEILLAEMETRLRRSVLKVVRPTLDKVTDMGSRFSAMQRRVDQHETILHQSAAIELEVKKLEEILSVVQDQLAKSSADAREFEAKTDTELTTLGSRTFKCEEHLQTLDNEISKIGRDFDRVWKETKRLQEQHDDSLKSIWHGVNGSLKKTEKAKEELMSDISEQQKVHEKLVEDIFGDGKGLNKVNIDIQALNIAIQPIPFLERQIEDTNARADEMDRNVAKCNSTCASMTQAFNDVRHSVDARLAGYDDSNKLVMNKLTAYHASVLKSVRTEFIEEIQASRNLREEIGRFESDTTETCDNIKRTIQEETAKRDSMLKEMTMDIAHIELRSKKDRAHLDRDLARVEQETQFAQEISESAFSGIDYLRKVLELALEGEKMSSSLQIQDFADRLGECWLGTPSDSKRKPATTQTAHSLEKLQPHYENSGIERRDFAAESMASLVPLDGMRGLAKLEYLPGAISYEGRQFDRRHFLLHHHRMVSKAKAYLDDFKKHRYAHRGQGSPRRSRSKESAQKSPRKLSNANHPPLEDDGTDHPDASKITLQPSAKGGLGGNTMSGLPKGGSSGSDGSITEEVLVEQLKAMSGSGGFGQRPGSRHQPQAGGSKGFEGFQRIPEAQPSPHAAGLPDDHTSLTLPSIQAGSTIAGDASKVRVGSAQVRQKPVDSALQPPKPQTAR